MTAFVVSAVALTALALLWVLPPLLRRRGTGGGVDRGTSNVDLLREQLADLDADLKSGTLSPQQYSEAREELERRVLEESTQEGQEGQEGPAGGRGGWRTAITLAVLIPVSALLLYLHVGAPEALSPQVPPHGGQSVTPEQVEQMVARLAARLDANPDDATGWVLLARSHVVMGRYQAAVKAYARASELVSDDADLLADYADALGMTQGRRLEGEPERLVMRALKADPNHVKALALAGSVAFEKKDFKGAVTYWERLLKVVPPESEIASSIRNSIAEARTVGGTAPQSAPDRKPTVAAATDVSGTVRLAPELASGAAPTDTVFIFARPVSGPRVPLAVLRRQVRDLPAAFTLDDSMAMSSAARLSDHAQVVVGARISKSGAPVAQPGDLEGLSSPVKVGDTGIAVVINSRVP